MRYKIWLYDSATDRRADAIELEPSQPFPLTIERDGRTYGLSDYAHRGRGGRCGEVAIYDSRIQRPPAGGGGEG